MTWNRDILGRVTTKTYPDNSQYFFTCEPRSGRLQKVETARINGTARQAVQTKYYLDGNIAETGYDELGRVSTRDINGSGAVTFNYDNLGRLSTVSNPLGLFTYGYFNQTPRLQSITSPGNALNTTFQYFPNAQDQRLQAIINTRAGGTALSRFDHGYDADGVMRSWTQQADSSTATVFELGYDLADRSVLPCKLA